jgi:hypothetical protein
MALDGRSLFERQALMRIVVKQVDFSLLQQFCKTFLQQDPPAKRFHLIL